MKAVDGGTIYTGTAIGVGATQALWGSQWSVQATVVGTGAVTATISVQVSNDLVGWVEIDEIALSDTTLATDIITVESAFRYARAECTAITGTGATVTVTLAGRAA